MSRSITIEVPPIVTAIIITAAVIIAAMAALPYIVSGRVDAVPETFYFEQNLNRSRAAACDGCISVMTLNIGHGRGKGFHQILQTRKDMLETASAVSGAIDEHRTDIAALQEIDGPVLWNGGLHFIDALAEDTHIAHGIWTKNVDIPALRYGTALLSSMPYTKAKSFTFAARPVVLPKGFTVGVFRTQSEKHQYICAVSLHLAPVLPVIRRKQAEIIIRTLENFKYPLVVMGDFNCGWNEGSAVRMMAEALSLKAWQPEKKNAGTHGLGGRRLDWILISEELEFVSYENLPERLSDHSAVRAEIRFSDD